MPLTHLHQLTMLKDILSEHLSDETGTISEYAQLNRLIDSLLSNELVSDEMKNQLQTLLTYSQKGESSTNTEEHIADHYTLITDWISDIENFI